jgi:hypothetical protein
MAALVVTLAEAPLNTVVVVLAVVQAAVVAVNQAQATADTVAVVLVY